MTHKTITRLFKSKVRFFLQFYKITNLLPELFIITINYDTFSEKGFEFRVLFIGVTLLMRKNYGQPN